MQISQKGIDLIKSFEGLRLTAYKAVPTEKYWTIGYGHYGSDVRHGEKITEAQAEALLKKDLQKYVDGVNSLVKVPVNQNQFDALVSFAYNCGVGALQTSTLLKKLNAKDYAGASLEFAKWNKSGGKVYQGLVTRRAKETALFNTPVAVAKPAPVKPASKPETYTVKAGDTLSEIGVKYGLSVSAIKSMNGLKSDMIYVGQVLRLVPKPVPVSKSVTYKVVAGDNLTKIGKKFGVSVATLKSLNGLKSDLIRVGQVLTIKK